MKKLRDWTWRRKNVMFVSDLRGRTTNSSLKQLYRRPKKVLAKI